MLVITIDRQSTHARNDLRVIRKFLAARWSSYLRIEAQMKKRLIVADQNIALRVEEHNSVADIFERATQVARNFKLSYRPRQLVATRDGHAHQRETAERDEQSQKRELGAHRIDVSIYALKRNRDHHVLRDARNLARTKKFFDSIKAGNSFETARSGRRRTDRRHMSDGFTDIIAVRRAAARVHNSIMPHQGDCAVIDIKRRIII